MMRFLISCGGTGGHLSPGIAIAEELVKRGHECRLVISRKQVDKRLVERYPELDFVASPGVPLQWTPLRFLLFLLEQAKAVVFALRQVYRYRPHAIVGFGGFITLGIAFVGFLSGRPIAFHEANRKPGRAIRLLRGIADRIYLPECVGLSGVPSTVVRHPGYPVRNCIQLIARNKARGQLGISGGGKLLVVLGGSQGAGPFNDWVSASFDKLAAEGINTYCITGMGKGQKGVHENRDVYGNAVRLHFETFSDNMAAVLCAADVVIARAGAGTIAELIHCETPSILIPYPHAADNHQEANARYLEKHGGCVVVNQGDIGGLFEEVRELVFNDWLLEQFRANLKRLQEPECRETIAKDLEWLAALTAETRNRLVDLPA